MCGIAGLSWDDAALVRTMLSRVAHRGPDGHGVMGRPGAVLGQQRLAIIDFATGQQPMATADGRYAITYNGEIYNHEEIRADLIALGRRFATRSDTEVILQAWAQWGPAALARLIGDYAFVIHDAQSRTLHLARDPLGVKPLYYAITPHGLAFASELKGLVDVPGVSRALDEEGLRRYFHYRYVPGDRTLLADIRKLEPGTYARWTNGELRIERHWQLPREAGTAPADPIVAVRELFVDSVRRRLMSEVPLGVYLSGGIDSASVAAVTAKLAGSVSTFTARFEDDDGDEAKHARLVAEAIGADHHEVMCSEADIARFPQMVWHLDEPVADPATLPMFVLSEGAKRHVTVALAGEGSDEIFAGYDNFKAGLVARGISRVIPFKAKLSGASRLAPAGNVRRAARTVLARDDADGYEELVRLFPAEETKALGVDEPAWEPPSLPAERPLLDRMQYRALTTWLPENFLLKGDRMTMSSAVELRVPFLDHRLVELAFSLPTSARIRGLTGKWALRQAMAPFVPKVIATRPKRGFDPPASRWLRSDLRTLYERLLAARTHEAYLKGPALRAFDDVRATAGRRSGFFAMQKAWSLVVFEAWYAMMVDGIDPRKLSG